MHGTVLTMFDEEGFWVGSVEYGRIKSQLLLKTCRNMGVKSKKIKHRFFLVFFKERETKTNDLDPDGLRRC